MAALPLPAAVSDDLISGYPGMRSSKMAAGSGRAAIFHHHHNTVRKVLPMSCLTSFPVPPSWNQDGGATSSVWRMSELPWNPGGCHTLDTATICPVHHFDVGGQISPPYSVSKTSHLSDAVKLASYSYCFVIVTWSIESRKTTKWS